MKEKQEQTEIQVVELAIGKILRIGVVVSAAIIACGLILLIVSGNSGDLGQTPNFCTYLAWAYHVATGSIHYDWHFLFNFNTGFASCCLYLCLF